MLKVKKLHPDAITPTVVNPGEDLAYDLYALEDTLLQPGKVCKVRTGISATSYKTEGTNTKDAHYSQTKLGMLIRDRSSMASKGIFTHGGVLDAGYTGEIMVLMTCLETGETLGHILPKGSKIAQMIPVEVLTQGEIVELNTDEELAHSNRGKNGCGSSGA